MNNQKSTKENSHPPEVYQKAREKVSKLKDFYLNLIAYCLIIPFLFCLDWYLNRSSPGFPIHWAYWPALGWGIALVFQAVDIFAGSDWEEKMIEKELQKHSDKASKS